ncbi:MAG: hypothetical protein ACRDFS_02345, partial [Chloroflexota bacterium]
MSEELSERPLARAWHSTAPFVRSPPLGSAVLLLGIVLLGAPLQGPASYPQLESLLAAVFPYPRGIVLGAAAMLIGTAMVSTTSGLLEVRQGGAEPAARAAARLPLWLGAALYATTLGLVEAGQTNYLSGILFLYALGFLSWVVASRYRPHWRLFTRVDLLLLGAAA